MSNENRYWLVTAEAILNNTFGNTTIRETHAVEGCVGVWWTDYLTACGDSVERACVLTAVPISREGFARFTDVGQHVDAGAGH